MAHKSRLTKPGEMPTSWMRPKRSTVVLLAFAVIVADAFLLLSSPTEGTLDARLAYTPSGAVAFLRGLGESSRAVYRLFDSVDFVFIVLYTTGLVTWLRFVRNRGAIPKRLHPILGVIPGAFDLAETLSIFVMLGDPENIPAILPWVAAVSTPLKWCSAVAAVGIAVWGEVRWIRSRRARRRAARSARPPTDAATRSRGRE